MTSANRKSERTLGTRSAAWRDRLSTIASQLASKKVEGIRLEYSWRSLAGEFDIECFAHGDPEHLYVPQQWVQDFVVVFAEILQARNPEWEVNTKAHGVFEWYVARNALIQRHVEPDKDSPPLVRYGF